MRKKSRFPFTVILNLIQNLYRFRVPIPFGTGHGKPGMTRKPKSSSRSFFPYISCKKTATFLKKIKFHLNLYLTLALKLSFLFFIFYFLFLNIHSHFFPENEKLDRAKKQVLEFPLDPEAHSNLAMVYLDMDNLGMAEKELSLAKSLSSTISSQVVAVDDALEIAKEKPNKIRKEIDFWEKVSKEKPDYRDAYFELAVLNYQIGQNDEAKKYLEQALELDPNFESAQKLEKILHP